MKVIKNPKLPGKVVIGRWLVGAEPAIVPDEIRESTSFKNALKKDLIQIVKENTKTVSEPNPAPSNEPEQTETETEVATEAEAEAETEAEAEAEAEAETATEKDNKAKEAKLFECPYCDKSYKTQAALKAHITKTHPEHKE